MSQTWPHRRDFVSFVWACLPTLVYATLWLLLWSAHTQNAGPRIQAGKERLEYVEGLLKKRTRDQLELINTIDPTYFLRLEEILARSVILCTLYPMGL